MNGSTLDIEYNPSFISAAVVLKREAVLSRRAFEQLTSRSLSTPESTSFKVTLGNEPSKLLKTYQIL
jgi:hypothetical protein